MKLTEPAYFVLVSLLDGPRHGYDIAAHSAEISAGRVKLSAGTLYGVLERLSSAGLIEPDREEKVSGRVRRYYRITGAGAEAARAEAERLRSAAALISLTPLGGAAS